MNNKLRSAFTLSLLSLMMTSGLHAQRYYVDEIDEGKPTSIGVYLGTQGAGLEARHKLHKDWNVRLGGGFLPMELRMNSKVKDVSLRGTYKSSFSNIHLLAEWRVPAVPPKLGLRVVGGLSYFITAQTKSVIKPKGEYYYGDIPLNDQYMGQINLDVDWSGIAPYLGISMLRAFPGKTWGINVDLGTYYLSKAKVDMTTSGYLTGNESNKDQIEKNLKGYRWLPVLQVMLNYKLQFPHRTFKK